jgi:hypothetical protein
MPTDVMTGTAFETDELDQKAGEKSIPHPDPADPPRRRANKRKARYFCQYSSPDPQCGIARDGRAALLALRPTFGMLGCTQHDNSERSIDTYLEGKSHTQRNIVLGDISQS